MKRADPHILCFLHGLGGGGVESVALRLCSAWAADGADVLLLLGHHAGPLPGLPPQMRVCVASAGRFVRPLRSLWLLAWLCRTMLKERPDAIFCAGNTYALVGWLAKAILGRKCPPMILKISNDLSRPDMPAMVRLFYHAWCWLQGRSFDLLVAIAAPMLDEIEQIARPHRRPRLVNDAVLLDLPLAARRANFGRPADAARRFVAIGRLETQKNYSLLLEAFAIGARAGDHLTVVGKGSLRGALFAQRDALGLQGRVRFVGQQRMIAPFLDHADALILSSLYEGMPAVLIEALAAGVPVIATACCPAVSDTLADGRCGTLVDSGDITALAGAIAAFDRLGFAPQAMRDRAAPFTVQHAAARYSRLFHVLARYRRREIAAFARLRRNEYGDALVTKRHDRFGPVAAAL